MRQSKNGSPSPRLLSNLVQLQMNYDLPVCVYRPQNASRCKSPWQLVSLSPVSRDLWCVFVSLSGEICRSNQLPARLCVGVQTALEVWTQPICGHHPFLCTLANIIPIYFPTYFGYNASCLTNALSARFPLEPLCHYYPSSNPATNPVRSSDPFVLLPSKRSV